MAIKQTKRDKAACNARTYYAKNRERINRQRRERYHRNKEQQKKYNQSYKQRIDQKFMTWLQRLINH